MQLFFISTGYFLKIDSSQGRPGDIADVQSPMFPSSRGVCYVRFFYYMYGGQHIGPLRVCTLVNNGIKNKISKSALNLGRVTLKLSLVKEQIYSDP